MENKRKVISFQEFAEHPIEVFEQVLQGAEVVVERDTGESIVLNVTESAHKEKLSPEKLKAFLSAAGSWSDVDTEALKAQLRASRDMPPRPPVDL